MSFWTSQYEAILAESNARDDYTAEITHELTDHRDADILDWERVDAIAPEYVSIIHDRTPCEESDENLF